jgi:hypothetical protein
MNKREARRAERAAFKKLTELQDKHEKLMHPRNPDTGVGEYYPHDGWVYCRCNLAAEIRKLSKEWQELFPASL